LWLFAIVQAWRRNVIERGKEVRITRKKLRQPERLLNLGRGGDAVMLGLPRAYSDCGEEYFDISIARFLPDQKTSNLPVKLNDKMLSIGLCRQ
jgi:hypothetical protein